MVYCEKCGKRIPKNATFCEGCGAKTPFAEEKLRLEKERKSQLKREKKEEFYNKLRQPRTLIPTIIIVFLILGITGVLFIPTKMVSYTSDIPYTEQEAYQHELAYRVVSEDGGKNEPLFEDWYLDKRVTILNTDSEGGTFKVEFTFWVNGEPKSKSDSAYIYAGNSAVLSAKDTRYGLFSSSFSSSYEVYPPTVTRYRTITKYRKETRYKKVNWIFGYEVPW